MISVHWHPHLGEFVAVKQGRNVAGRGATEEAAVADLLDLLAERAGEAAPSTQVVQQKGASK